MFDIFSFLPTHTLPWVTHSVCGFQYHPQYILSTLLQIHIFMSTWPTEPIIGITDPTYPNISSWYSNFFHPLLHLLLLRLWQLHSSHCSGSQSWWYLWLPPPFLSLSTSDLPKNLLTPAFKICPEFNHFLPYQLPLPWSKPPSSLCLNYCISFPIIFLDSVLDLSCSIFNTAVRMILLKALWCFPCPRLRAQRA